MKEKPWRVRRSRFGLYYSFPIPLNCDVVVVCSNDNSGLVPLKVLLPHQVYLKDTASIPGLTILPAYSGDRAVMIREPGHVKRAGAK
mgnify:CR=1 FL=1